MLGYFTISAARSPEVKDVIKSARLSEMKKAYREPHCKTITDLRDTSRWRMAKFHKICREDFGSNAALSRHELE